MPSTSALHRALDPDGAAWGETEHLLAFIADVLNGANWQRAGNKRAPKPKPIPRPGDERRRRERLAGLASRWKATTRKEA